MKEIYNEYYYVLRDEINLDDFFKKLFSVRNKSSDSEVVVINIGKQYFDFQYNNKNYKCYYEAIKNYKDKEILSLKIGIYYEKNKEQAAKILSEVLLKIEKNRNNKFYSITLEDNLSMYYSQRTFKHLAVYERSIRKLIISIFVPLHSKNWSKEILSQVPDFKGAGKEVYIEKGLEELSLSDLENLLFKKRFHLNSENYNEVFKPEDIKKMDINELVHIIEKNKPYSLWDKYFSQYAMVDNPEQVMKEIKKERDKIAHHRYFSKHSYQNVTNNLDYLIPKIQRANDNIVSHHNQTMIIDFAITINRIPEIAKKIQESFRIMLEEISKIKDNMPKIDMSKVIDINKTFSNINIPKIDTSKLSLPSEGENYSNIQKNYFPNYAKSNYLDWYGGSTFFINEFVKKYSDKNER